MNDSKCYSLIRLLDTLKALSEAERALILLHSNLTEGDFQDLYSAAVRFLKPKNLAL